MTTVSTPDSGPETTSETGPGSRYPNTRRDERYYITRSYYILLNRVSA